MKFKMWSNENGDDLATQVNQFLDENPDIDIVGYGLFYKKKVFTHEQKLFEKYLERVFIDHNENIIQTIIYCNSNPGKMHHEERLAYRSLTINEINQVVNRITK